MDLLGTILKAATIVGNPAYQGRTPFLAVASRNEQSEAETEDNGKTEDTSMEVNDLEARIAELEPKLNDAQAQLESLATQLSEKEAEIARLTTELEAKEAELIPLRQFIEEFDAEVAKAEKLSAIKSKFTEAGLEKADEYFEKHAEALLKLDEDGCMKFRSLGRTGLPVSEIGYGAWGIGTAMWVGAEDDTSPKALHHAADLGLNFIDTALAYGNGHSEHLVGSFVRQRSERIVVATKIPPKNGRWPPRKGTALREAFPADYIIERTETSLRNLALDAIDLQQLHVWTDEWTDDAEWYDALSTLREQGKIRFFGVSINDHDPASALRLVGSGKVDAVQV